MTPELIAIVAMGATLAALILRQGAHFERRIDDLKQEVGERFDKVDERFDKLDGRFDKLDKRFDKLIERFDKLIERFKSLEGRMTRIGEKQHAKLEGPLEGMREAATCNRAAVEGRKIAPTS